MAATDVLVTAMERNWSMVDQALEGLDAETLNRCPTDQCNSIAWILWHWTRVVDTFIHTRLTEQPQLWITEGWHQKFGMEGDPDQRGVGWSAADVTAWEPPATEVQLGYYEVVKAAARQYISSLNGEALEVSRVIAPLPEPRTVGSALGQMTWESVAHGGQIAYLRGLFQGAGWFGM